mmetsp:Transcript_8959/g.15263  ORF Transcript_8959/g.15263 Transcript_8959/m.15263 type:complete len:213 (+) Transcript_8959:529-1167(+)
MTTTEAPDDVLSEPDELAKVDDEEEEEEDDEGASDSGLREISKEESSASSCLDFFWVTEPMMPLKRLRLWRLRVPSGILSSGGDSERGFGEMSRVCVGVCDTERFAGGVSLMGESLMGEEEAEEDDDEEDVERDSGSVSGSSSVSASTTVFVFFAFFVFFGFGSARFSTLVAGGGVTDVLVPGAAGMGGEDTRGLEKAWMESTEFIFEGEVE